MLLTLLLTISAPVPKTEPADWKAAIQDRAFDYPSQPNRAADSAAAARKPGLTTEYALDPSNTQGLFTVAKTGGPEVRAAIRKYTKVEDDAALQSTVDFYREFFPVNLRVPEKSVANMLQFVALDHPEARALDPRVLYDNSLIDEVLREPGR